MKVRLALGCMLLAAVAHLSPALAQRPTARERFRVFKLKTKVKADYLWSRVRNRPARYSRGALVSTKSQRPVIVNGEEATESMHRTFRVGEKGQLHAEHSVQEYRSSSGKSFLRIADDHVMNRRWLVSPENGGVREQLTTFLGRGRAQIPEHTITRTFDASGKMVKHDFLDRQSGIRRTTDYHGDGTHRLVERRWSVVGGIGRERVVSERMFHPAPPTPVKTANATRKSAFTRDVSRRAQFAYVTKVAPPVDGELRVDVGVNVTPTEPSGNIREFSNLRLRPGGRARVVDNRLLRLDLEASPDGKTLTQRFAAKSHDGKTAAALDHGVEIRGIEDRPDGRYVTGSIYATRQTLAIKDEELAGASRPPPGGVHVREQTRNGVHLTFKGWTGYGGTEATGYGSHYGEVAFSAKLAPGQKSIDLGSLAGSRVKVRLGKQGLAELEVASGKPVPEPIDESQLATRRISGGKVLKQKPGESMHDFLKRGDFEQQGWLNRWAIDRGLLR